MKHAFTKKLGFAVAAVVVGLILPLATIASYSPERPTKQYHDGVAGFDHVTFNSFTGVPKYGDERVFYSVKDANDSSGYWDSKNVTPGQELLLRTYVHNNADSSLNASGAGVARNTKVKILLPSDTDTALRSISYISADNAQPGTVSASVNLNGSSPFRLEYETGSAKAYTNAVPSGIQLSDNIVSGGAPIGYDKADGNLPGCFQYAALVTIKVRVKAPALSVTKQVGIPGSGKWEKTVNAKPGDTLSYQVGFKNNGNDVAHHVVMTDKLPAHVTVVPGSVKLYNTLHKEGVQLSDTGLFTAGGVDTGDYAVGASGYVQYKVKVKDDFKETTNVDNVGCVGSNESRKDVCDTARFVVTVKKTPVIPNTPSTPATPATPAAPATLPATGAEGALATTVGMGGLSYASYAYLKSKKALTAALEAAKK